MRAESGREERLEEPMKIAGATAVVEERRDEKRRERGKEVWKRFVSVSAREKVRRMSAAACRSH